VLAGAGSGVQVRRRVERTRGELRVHLVLHLTCDADPGRREVILDPVFRIGGEDGQLVDAAPTADGGRKKRRKRIPLVPQEQIFEFETQHVVYPSN